MIEALYNQRIRELADTAHGAGRLAAPSASALRDSPMCGDRVRIDVAVANGRIAAVAHEVKGCLLCRAAASLIGLYAIGLSAGQTDALRARVAAMLAGADVPDDLADLAMFQPVRAHRSRHGCVLIPFEALAQAAGAA
jgi:NifU-like protein involved in Fe-S cluster formation